MEQPARRTPLLGRIAELGWFLRRGEPAATQSLAILLEDRSLRESVLSHWGSMANVDLSTVSYVVAEPVHDDGGRPDLEGYGPDGSIALSVEAKFGARMDAAQIVSYLVAQVANLPTDGNAALILLVPPRRVAEAQAVLASAIQDALHRAPAVEEIGTAVDTWADCIAACSQGAADSPLASTLVTDVTQFEAMCRALEGPVIGPLGDAAARHLLEERKEDLREIVRQTTDLFVSEGDRFPIGDEIGYECRRYIPGGDADPSVFCSVGIGSRFADARTTPFWLRYHRGTPGFSLVSTRLGSSLFSTQIRRADRHLWLPLRVDSTADGNDLVEQLAAQIRQIIAAASTPGS